MDRKETRGSDSDQPYKHWGLLLVVGFCLILSACGIKRQALSPAQLNAADTKSSIPIVQQQPVPSVIPLRPALQQQLQRHPGKSGFRFLPSGVEAFASLYELVRSAKYNIDLQYYIYHDDKTGKLLTYELLRAANRGVKVRLLVDDIFMSGKSEMLSLLDAHPNIQVRVFNPVSRKRYLRPIAYFVNIGRINRRMHNKVFVVDDQYAMMGGRNIGDAYFSMKEHFQFKDVDVLTIGPVVAELKNSFELYWKSRWSVSYESAHPYLYGFHYNSELYNKSYFKYLRFAHKLRRTRFLARVKSKRMLKRLAHNELPLVWGKASVMVDPPRKAKRFSLRDKKFLYNQIRPYLQNAQHEVTVITPYFVPGHRGMRWIKAMRKRGVVVNVLTNSFASTDVAIAHTGYQRYRRRLLRYGVNINELKPNAFASQKKEFTWIKNSIRSSLHAKIIIVDRKYVFVGSANFSQRSLWTNTEIMIKIENPEVARAALGLYHHFSQAKNSYRLALRKSKTISDTSQELVWETRVKGQKVEYSHEPKAKLLNHMGATMMGILPLEGFL